MSLPKTLRILALLPLLGTSGCIAGTIHLVGRATGLKPPAWDGGVQVASQPAGQRCVAERDGTPLATVEATPGRMVISRSVHAYQLRCSGADALETVHTFRPEGDPGAFVPLPTGPVGAAMLAAAMASGSISRFPPQVSIESPPARFSSSHERDAYFAARTAALVARFSEEERIARVPCVNQMESTVCDSTLAQVALRRGDAEETLRAQITASRAADAPQLASR